MRHQVNYACLKCGTYFRYIKDNACCECRKRYASKWRQENREKCSAYSRSGKAKRRDKNNQYSKAWRALNKDKITKYNKQWRQANRQHINQYAKDYAKANPLVKRVSEAKRRASLRGSYTANQIKDLYAKQFCKCANCLVKLLDYHIDHIMPLSKEGSNYITNIQLLCPHCNMVKQAKDPIVFARENGRLL